MNRDILLTNLRNKGYTVSVFASKEDAAAYLNREIRGVSVGFGGSVTLQEMNLYSSLSEHNTVFWHWEPGDRSKADILKGAMTSDVYLTSVNAIAESGEVVNIDGTCNRVSAMLYGHKKVYFVVGQQKITETLDEAVSRARNVAAPMNAKRLDRKTPCVKVGKCCDCASPERICSALSVLWKAPSPTYEMILISENIGY